MQTSLQQLSTSSLIHPSVVSPVSIGLGTIESNPIIKLLFKSFSFFRSCSNQRWLCFYPFSLFFSLSNFRMVLQALDGRVGIIMKQRWLVQCVLCVLMGREHDAHRFFPNSRCLWAIVWSIIGRCDFSFFFTLCSNATSG